MDHQLRRLLQELIDAYGSTNPALLKDLLRFQAELDQALKQKDRKFLALVLLRIAEAIKPWLDN